MAEIAIGASAKIVLAPRRAAVTAASARYRVTLVTDWAQAAPRWEAELQAGAAATPFQSRQWLDALYGALQAEAGIEPLIAFVDDAQAGFAFALPLVRRHARGATRVEFADRHMTDFNAPLLGAAAPMNGTEALAALRRALPPADVLDLRKMPPTIEGRINPFAHLRGARASAVNGNLIELGEDFDAWRASLPRQTRKEMDRHWRVFTRHEGAAFRIVTDPQEAQKLLPALNAMQRRRLEELGEPYALSYPAPAALHRGLIADGIANGLVVLSLLSVGTEIVAAAMGVRRGDSIVMIRLCQAGGKWSNCAPGRLVLAQTLRRMHGEGCRKFDLSIGNFAYKRRFHVTRQPLMDLATPLSWKGRAVVARLRAGAWLRQHPGLRRYLRRALGKRACREED